MEEKILETNSPEETFALGRKIGENAREGSLFCLSGDLGAGKTVFTQGLAAGLGVSEPVSSPTFTILQVYEGGRCPLYHFDVYRIGDISEIEEIGCEDCFYGDGISLVEWGDLIEAILPEHCVRITMLRDPQKGCDYRKIMIEDT